MLFFVYRVDELKERLEQVEQENRQAQETISFKDNELEVLQLYSLYGGNKMVPSLLSER